jgi:predicted AAA+ superfamily ATPase
MPYIHRDIEPSLIKDLSKKMVFISGPRQCGKTTLANKIIENFKTSEIRAYMNWDFGADREHILKEQFPAGSGILVLDEIHRYSRWRQVVKGLFDKRKHELKILVTGSGQLDYYRHGGDSLQGRYYSYRLHPFALNEISTGDKEDLLSLFRYGGFPEPFLSASEKETRRWSRDYRSRVINEDLSSLETVKDISLLELLALRLPELVGSPLSINAIRNDLQVTHQSVSRWLLMLERVYMIFRIYPFGAPAIRAVKKEAKHYHFDWTILDDEAVRFENLVACHLLKWVHFQQDSEGLDIDLRYFRDIDRREVDFVITKNNEPTHFIECKLRGKEINPALKYLKTRFPEATAFQISLYREDSFVNKDGIHVCPAYDFLLNPNS